MPPIRFDTNAANLVAAIAACLDVAFPAALWTQLCLKRSGVGTGREFAGAPGSKTYQDGTGELRGRERRRDDISRHSPPANVANSRNSRLVVGRYGRRTSGRPYHQAIRPSRASSFIVLRGN
jgi:hypothetical protein